MKFIGGLAFIACLLVMSCSHVPVTGRKQLALVPQEQLNAASVQQYDSFLTTHKVLDNTPEGAMVIRVGQKIQSAVEQYFAQNKLSDRLKGYAWEFHLVEDTLINAWCMPGGKVVVYTGILPYTQDETGLAVVMGHEVSHAVANHGDERLSQALLVQLGGLGLQAALMQKPQATQQVFLAAYGAGAQVGVLLPYSRTQETESDRLGLIFMAMAGYDPNRAVEFWQRMSQSGGAKPPEFLSTHPSDQRRIKNIQKHIPEAMKYYKQTSDR